MKLYFPEITFQASHYIPGHEHCGSPHGHTYFVRNISIEVTDNLDEKGISVDFGVIKDYFKQWDHKNIIPLSSEIAWRDFYKVMGFKDNLKPLNYTSAEFIAVKMRNELSVKIGVPFVYIHFELWEGPNQAVIV